MHFFPGSSHPALGAALAKELNVESGNITTKRFSSGECYVRFNETVRGKNVFLLQAPGLHPDEDLFELLLMAQAARLSFAAEVHAIIPYLPYARQDRISSPREPISAKLIARMLEEAGVDHLITMNLHSDQIQGFFDIPVDNLDARSLFVDYFRGKNLQNTVVVSPDIGGAKQAKKMADLLGTELAILHKTRQKHNEAEMLEIVGDIEGKTCILYDDMIDTAGTLVSAKKMLEEKGAGKDVYVAATHAVLSGPAIERLEQAGFAEVIVTDSIAHEHSYPWLKTLSIAPLLGLVVKYIERKESVTQIYKQAGFED